jgi:hypothetical protein
MGNYKLISEDRIDDLIEKSKAFIDTVKLKEHLEQEELKLLLIMEGQLLAYQMIKHIVLKPLR